MGRRQITVEVSDEALELLEVLGASYAIGGTASARRPVEAVIAHLVHSAADGVRRPGSWERGWAEQAFGSDWEGV